MVKSLLPNLTSSFINFFIASNSKNLKNKTLLEIGAGDSTIFWADYFKMVNSYEDNQYWIHDIYDNDPPENIELFAYDPKKIFSDDGFKNKVETSDFIIIDNNPKVLPREMFCEFVERHQSNQSQVILDNCTWNLDAYNFMLSRYFCMDFPGTNKNGETTVTSLFFAKKTAKYFNKEQIKIWEKSS